MTSRRNPEPHIVTQLLALQKKLFGAGAQIVAQIVGVRFRLGTAGHRRIRDLAMTPADRTGGDRCYLSVRHHQGAEIIWVAVPFCASDDGSIDRGSTLPSLAVDSQIITPDTGGVGGVQILTS